MNNAALIPATTPMSHQLQTQNRGGSGTSVKPVNVLCLDGGGVRGLSSLLILRDLLQQLPTDGRTHRSPLPCEVFDLVCGTSTGGIIALMLGRLRMNVDDAIASYLDFSKRVFQDKRPSETAKYDASKLQKWMEELVSKYEESKRTSLHDPSDAKGTCCRTFVVAVTKSFADSPPKCFRTYAANGRPADRCAIWEAARATTAAIPFFEPATFGNPRETYVDGSFSGSNNPSQLAIEELGDIFPSRKIGCFLSLGTGVPSVVNLPDDADGVAKACMELIKNCENVHNTTYKDFKRNARGKGYIRLSVNRGLESIQLDEWKREIELTSITGAYLRHAEVEDRVTNCVTMLKAKAMEVLAAQEDSLT